MFLKYLPGDLQVTVTFSLNGTNTLSGSDLIIDKPSLRSSDNVTQRASEIKKENYFKKVPAGNL